MTSKTQSHLFLKKVFLISAIAFPVSVFAQTEANKIQVISQKNRTYAPGEVEIKTGEKLRIVNDDIFLHHAFVDNENFTYDSGSMEEDETRDIIFDKTGTYEVRCAIHPKMLLEVTVKP